MAQLVFVHGVKTRPGPAYDTEVKNREALFQKTVFDGGQIQFHTPMWGDLVPEIDRQVYSGGRLATAFSVFGQSASSSKKTTEMGLNTAAFARSDAAAALDAIFVKLLESKSDLTEGDLADFAIATDSLRVDAYNGDAEISIDGAKYRFGHCASDRELVAAFSATGGVGAYSSMDGIAGAISAVSDSLRNIASRAAFDPLVDWLRPSVGVFLGDVFAYLKDGTTRDEIRSRVRDSLLSAQLARRPGETLIVIGHSLGGVILTDMLYNRNEVGLPNDLRIDTLMTVGSQAGLFQSLGLMRPPSAGKLPAMENVAKWFNVYDPVDPLAFQSSTVFNGVQDLAFNSVTGVVSAHTTYFKRPQFYARTKLRLGDVI